MIRSWKVYGAEGHKQKESIEEEVEKWNQYCDFTNTHERDYYKMSELEEMLRGVEDDILESDFDKSMPYFTQNSNGKLISVDRLLDVYKEELSRKVGRRLNMHNTVRGIFVSADITKEDVRRNHIKSIDDILSYVIDNDPSPDETAAYRLDCDKLAECWPSNEMNWTADVIVNSPNRIHVSFTCKEYYTSSDDDEFIDGSDYDDFAEFSEDQKHTLLDFLG